MVILYNNNSDIYYIELDKPLFISHLIFTFNSHMIFSPSIVNAYGSDVFPAISDTIYLYKKNNNSEILEEIKRQYSILIHSIQSASSVLKEPYNFNRYTF